MMLSTPGLIGAAIGLLLALAAYVVVMPQFKRTQASDGTPINIEAIRMILLADFVVLAVVGYFIGQLLFD
jgi:hypothetical protein